MFINLSRLSKKDGRYTRKGFYYPSNRFSHNFHIAIDMICGYKIKSNGLLTGNLFNTNGEQLSWYGVADNEDQVYDYYKDLENSSRKFVVSLTPVYKKYHDF